ncbi:TetR/AcrR family transcriptional regulator [Nocardia sp. NPDC050799]|uniref:TetR/AcrR family transcriptional regulator n=1 Tax=Nocardia sp. NPDC050799 TaxID=3154842 RepID=UPI0033CFE3C1
MEKYVWEVYMSIARQRLLERLLSTFGEELPGPSLSLREIATRAGTSHALLRYHFGSHAGVLTAMLVAQREQDNEVLIRGSGSANFPDLVERIWELYTHPKRIARVRSFFLVAGLAAQGDSEAFTDFISSLGDLSSLLADVARRDGDSEEGAVVRATVTVAAIRGLLLQEVLAPGALTRPALRLICQLGSPSAEAHTVPDGSERRP